MMAKCARCGRYYQTDDPHDCPARRETKPPRDRQVNHSSRDRQIRRPGRNRRVDSDEEDNE